MTLKDMTVALHASLLALSEPVDPITEEKVFKSLRERYSLHGITLSALDKSGKWICVAFSFTKDGMYKKILNIVLQQITLLNAERDRETLKSEWFFDCPFDIRKAAFEKHIQYAGELLGTGFRKKLVYSYTVLLNKRFLTPHWEYDNAKCSFKEISHSKEINEKELMS